MGYTIHRSTIFHESANNILIRLAGFPPHIFCQTCFELIIIEKEREEKGGEKEKKRNLRRRNYSSILHFTLALISHRFPLKCAINIENFRLTLVIASLPIYEAINIYFSQSRVFYVC